MTFLMDAIESLVKRGLRKLSRSTARNVLATFLVAVPTANRILGTVTRDYS